MVRMLSAGASIALIALRFAWAELRVKRTPKATAEDDDAKFNKSLPFDALQQRTQSLGDSNGQPGDQHWDVSIEYWDGSSIQTTSGYVNWYWDDSTSNKDWTPAYDPDDESLRFSYVQSVHFVVEPDHFVGKIMLNSDSGGGKPCMRAFYGDSNLGDPSIGGYLDLEEQKISQDLNEHPLHITFIPYDYGASGTCAGDEITFDSTRALVVFISQRPDVSMLQGADAVNVYIGRDSDPADVGFSHLCFDSTYAEEPLHFCQAQDRHDDPHQCTTHDL